MVDPAPHPALHLEPLTPALGVAVHGLDLAGPVADDVVEQLRRAFRRHQLLLFRGQDLDDGRHAELISWFGPLAAERSGTVGFVSNHRPGGSLGSIGASYHIDYGFFPAPYEAISLYGLEIPASGTETWFVSALAAARSLPDALRARVRGLHARHAVDIACPEQETVVRVRAGRLDEGYPHAVRPVLWPHRLTGEPVLGVWEQQTDAIVELEPDASTALIEELFAHLYRPEHGYVHRWAPGDLLVWDNHALQHARPDVGTAEPRTLRRVCVGETQDLSIFATYRRRGGSS